MKTEKIISLPKKVNVLGYDLEIVLDPKEFEKNKHDGIPDCYGYFRLEHQKIYLDKNLPAQLLNETLLHEILHAIFGITGLAAKHVDEEGLEEDIIATISPNLVDIMKRNKNLKQALFEEANDSKATKRSIAARKAKPDRC